MAEIDTSLIPDYVAEAAEHLEEMESSLLALEDDPGNGELLANLFRCFHTIKGAAQFVGLEKTSVLAHRAEDLLDLLREGERPLTPGIFEVLIQTKDRLESLLQELDNHQREESEVQDLVTRLSAFIEGGEQGAATASEATAETAQASPPEAASTTEVEETEAAEDSPALPSADWDKEEEYDEELDPELFHIFQNQLVEELVTLRGLFDQLVLSETPTVLLADAAEILERLRSAANYMDYESLVHLYDQWLDSLELEQEKAVEGEEIEVERLKEYIERILERFPQLADRMEEVSRIREEAITTPVPQEAAETKPEAKTPEPVQPEPTPQEEGPPPREPAPEASAEPPLMDAFTTALAESLEETPTNTADPLESVFDEMLVGDLEALESSKKTTAKPSAPSRREEQAKGSAPTQPAELPPRQPTAPSSETAKKAKKTTGIERALKRSVRVDAEKIDTLMNQVGELIVHRSYFNQIFNETRSLQQRFEAAGLPAHELKAFRALSYRFSEAIVSLSRTANELQEGVMKVRMLPISQLFNRYPRLVHDLVRNTDKRVRIEMRGEDTELDKMIIEEVSDPLIHIIRNAVDHGFESVEERRQQGKPEMGTLLLEAYHESNHIVIEVSDDGRGIDPDLVRRKALEKGLITPEELARMQERDILRLIMAPGFSTAQTVTDTSGRGVGMDVVRKNVEKLNGTIEIDSEPGKRTRFRLKIPLTLAIISALQVRVGNHHFTIPLANVEETLRVFKTQTTQIEGIEVIHLRGRTMPIFRLSALFHLEGQAQQEEKFFVVIVNTGGDQVGLVVDELLGQDEVVIKPLVDYLQEGSGFSGATIIGDGRISLILDVYELVKMTALRQARIHQELAKQRRHQIHANPASLH